MSLKIRHTTQYHFETPATYALQKVRLTPLPSALQEVISWDVIIEGGKIEASYRDHFGNHVDLVSADVGTNELSVTATGDVLVQDKAGVLGKVYGRAPLWHFLKETPQTKSNARIKKLSEIIQASDTVVNGLHGLSKAILEAVPYQTGQTDAGTTAQEAIEMGKGVCQDHSNIFLSAARLAGIPARYVSGYLRMNDRVEQDASHAWAEAHLDGLGWVGFDVSSGISPDTNYVRLAVGCDAQDAAPISGLRMGTGDETMIVSLQVQQ